MRCVCALREEGSRHRAGEAGTPIAVPVRAPKLWSPDAPFLYDVQITLVRNGRTLDVVGSYAGMRTIALARDDRGIQRLMLNGKACFQVGPLDQGFWPDGIYTAPTDAALRYDIEITKELGFNMTRKHVKVEPARWYYWADRLGLLVLAGYAQRQQHHAGIAHPVRERTRSAHCHAPALSLDHHVGGLQRGLGTV